MDIFVPQSRYEADPDDGKRSGYTVYCVECRSASTGELISSRWQRFSEFDALTKELTAAGFSAPIRPPKNRLTLTSVDTDERRIQLERSLQAYIQSQTQLPDIFVDWLGAKQPRGHSSRDSAHTTPGGVPSAVPSGPEVTKAIALMRAHAMFASARTIDAKVEEYDEWRKRLVMLACSFGPLALSLRGFGMHVGDTLWLFWLLLGVTGGLFVGAVLWWHAAAEVRDASTVAKDRARRDAETAGLSRAFAKDALTDGAVFAHAAAMLGAQEVDLTRSVASTPPLAALAKLPSPMVQEMQRCSELLLLNLKDDVNCVGSPWEVESDSKGLQVWSSAIPGDKKRYWKSRFQTSLRGTVQNVRDHIFQWEHRLRWDKSFPEGTDLKSYEDGYTLSRYCSAALGPVSSREFIDLHWRQENPDGSGFLNVATSPVPEQLPGDVPQIAKGAIRASTQPGAGMRCQLDLDGSEADGPDMIRVTIEIVANADLKGWLPTKAISMAMKDGTTGSSLAMMKYFPATNFTRATGATATGAS